MATLKNLTINDTGFVQVASGTSAERGTAVNGAIRTNTTNNKVEMYSNGAWVTVDGTVASQSGGVATGGTVSKVGGYRIHTFTTTGADSFVAPYTGRVEVLVVGGGGGGAGIGGGGGAGGYIYNSNFPVVGGTAYPTLVGTGGTGPGGHGPAGGQGTNSQFGTIVSLGGGGGCPYSGGTKTATGGSGGGGPGGLGTPGTNYTSYPGEHPGGYGTPGQGHPGGYGHHGSGPGYPNPGTSQGGGANHSGGGGGGAGSKGVSAYSNGADRAGGRGIASTITGSSVIYAAGGGAGGHDFIYSWGPCSGGAGDGTGQGGRSPNGGAVAATAGGTNRGGGGGGASHPAPDVSAPGGPGIVVVRYKV